MNVTDSRCSKLEPSRLRKSFACCWIFFVLIYMVLQHRVTLLLKKPSYFVCLIIYFFSCRISSSGDKSSIVASVQESPQEEKGKMGRKKIQISRIGDERNRQVCICTTSYCYFSLLRYIFCYYQLRILCVLFLGKAPNCEAKRHAVTLYHVSILSTFKLLDFL